jgi:tetratricopeptide (TPR) repeat protein
MDLIRDPQLPDRRRSDTRLNSWKAIGAFFERDERTVKRWERQRGLPVHRIPGAGRSSVYAYTSELTEWLKTTEALSELSTSDEEAHADAVVPEIPAVLPPQSVSTSRRRPGMILALAGALLVCAIAGIVVYRRSVSARGAFASARPAGLKPAASPEAEELYLQGLYQWNKRTPESLSRALDDFTQSIVRDPNYAPAYVGLANCYNLLREYTLMPANEAYPRAMAAAKRAIALDDSLAEAHNSLAFVDFYWSWDAPGAEHEFQRAIVLDPNSVVAHHWYATFLMALGRSEDALAEIEKARKLDPKFSPILADKGLILFLAGQTAEAIALLKQIETTEPAFLSPHAYLAEVELDTKNYKDYLSESRKTALILQDQNRLKIVTAGEKGFAVSGGAGMLRAMLSAQQELYANGGANAYDLALTYCLLGDKQRALDLLQTAVAKRETRATSVRIEYSLRPLHDDPSFRKLIAQVGLPPLEGVP